MLKSGVGWFRQYERFADRRAAGRKLAAALSAYAGRDDLLVLGLPRGGVPVAYEVATALHAPLDVWLVRKLGVPGHEELALGAIADGGARVLNAEIIVELGITPEDIDRVTALEQRELARRHTLYRGERPPPDVRGKTVILVDDGLATGSTMQAAIASVRAQEPRAVVVAVPVAPPVVRAEFAGLVDDFVCLLMPDPFRAVGLWYEDFSPTEDDEVRALLAASQ